MPFRYDINVAVACFGAARRYAQGNKLILALGLICRLPDNFLELLLHKDKVIRGRHDNNRIGISLEDTVAGISNTRGCILTHRFRQDLLIR